jgi:hypothetical protein
MLGRQYANDNSLKLASVQWSFLPYQLYVDLLLVLAEIYLLSLELLSTAVTGSSTMNNQVGASLLDDSDKPMTPALVGCCYLPPES